MGGVTPPNAPLRVATRGSEQARTQAAHVADRLAAVTGRRVELVFVDTAGDRQRDRPIAEIGGRGVFTKEVQLAVLDGRADLAVHSAKDLPSSWTTDGLTLAGVPERGDPRDALVGSTLAGLTRGATVATGSTRRRTQLAHLRPDLHFVGLRGNIPTRVARADAPDVDAAIVAVAGATWVGLADRLAHVFAVDVMVPQVGQGALAVECRADDAATAEAIAAIEDPVSRRRVDAERAFLAELGGGCELPVGAHAVVRPDGGLHVIGLIASADGREVLRDERDGDDAHVGAALARGMLARGAHLLER
jgi:hydroxymethylbilane synthase